MCGDKVLTPETNPGEIVYTLGLWHVRKGQQQAFISVWKELGEIFGSLPNPPVKGILIQSDSDSTSFGPWSNREAVNAIRNDQRAQEGIGKLTDLCTKGLPVHFT